MWISENFLNILKSHRVFISIIFALCFHRLKLYHLQVIRGRPLLDILYNVSDVDNSVSLHALSVPFLHHYMSLHIIFTGYLLR